MSQHSVFPCGKSMTPYPRGLTGKQGHVGVLGVIWAARHPTDLLTLGLQRVHLGSEMKRSGVSNVDTVNRHNTTKKRFMLAMASMDSLLYTKYAKVLLVATM